MFSKRRACFQPRVEGLEDRCLLSAGINEFSPPTQIYPLAITSGFDGNLWFTESLESGASTDAIGRITPSGVFTQIPIPAPPAGFLNVPIAITAGPDNSVWFTNDIDNEDPEFSSLDIGQITPAGVVTEFPVTPQSPIVAGGDITVGPDGNLWFDVSGPVSSIIGRMTPGGVVATFQVADSSDLGGITTGPDGNLWFTELDAGKIGRITPLGAITEFALPSGAFSVANSEANTIVAGPDGNLWFTSAYDIGQITTQGAVTLFPLPAGHTDAVAITVGSDGNLWFTENDSPYRMPPGSDYIGQITPSGVITEYQVPTAYADVDGIASGSDGNIWFAELGSGKIGELVLNSPGLTPAPGLTTSPNNSFQGTVATFTANAPASAYSATIYWGDGTSSPGTVSGAGQLAVTGSHDFVAGAATALPIEIVVHGPDAVSLSAESFVNFEGPQMVFVENLYADLLHRQADNAGLYAWMNQMSNGVTPAQIVLGIEQSSEYRTDVIDNLYATLLGREPDQAGLDAFLQFMRGGASQAQVEQTILASPEYYLRSGGTIFSFLSATYQAVLGRAPDVDGELSLGLKLLAGATRQSVAAQMLSSAEFQQDQIQGYYQLLLHRAADSTGLASFSAELTTGTPSFDVLATIASSAEFYNEPMS
jgi:virginiamycin B lyase